MNDFREVLMLFNNDKEREAFLGLMHNSTWTVSKYYSSASDESTRILCVTANKNIVYQLYGVTFHAIVCPKNYHIPNALAARIRPLVGREEEIKTFLTKFINNDNIVEMFGNNLDYITRDDCGMFKTNYDDDKEESVMESAKDFNLKEALDGKPFITESGYIGYILKDLSTLKLANISPEYPLVGFVNGQPLIRYTLDGSPSCGLFSSEDLTIKGMYVEPAQFSAWDVIDEKWRFIAADEDWDGEGYNVHLYTEEPKWDYVEEVWYIDDGSDGEYLCITALKQGLFTYDSPETSLVERPVNNKVS